MTLRALIGCLPVGQMRIEGDVRIAGRDLTGLAGRALADFRGRTIAMFFQEPMTALDVTVQIQIILLLRRLRRELGMAVSVTPTSGSRWRSPIGWPVMYSGRFVESGQRRR